MSKQNINQVNTKRDLELTLNFLYSRTYYSESRKKENESAEVMHLDLVENVVAVIKDRNQDQDSLDAGISKADKTHCIVVY